MAHIPPPNSQETKRHRSPRKRKVTNIPPICQVSELRAIWLKTMPESRFDEFLTPKEVATILSCTAGRVHGIAQEGKIRSLKVSGRRYFYRPDVEKEISED